MLMKIKKVLGKFALVFVDLVSKIERKHAIMFGVGLAVVSALLLIYNIWSQM